MNSAPAPSKRSQIERFVDRIIFFMFFLLFSFCFTGAVYDAYWIQQNFNNHWYLGPQYTNEQYNPATPAVNGITNFVTAFILYGYLIPISLYVSLEIVKVIQSMVFISSDLEMYHEETDTPALARTSNLNEDLGQVNTVLSDKTGTLTRNVMEFFKCSIAGVSYGAGVTEIEKSNALRRGEVINEMENPGLKKFHERFFNFYDERLMDQAWTKEKDTEAIEMFFRLLAVCHTVIPEGEPTPKEIKYAAESPDEVQKGASSSFLVPSPLTYSSNASLDDHRRPWWCLQK
jgi:phospholipid-transporting ATPase